MLSGFARSGEASAEKRIDKLRFFKAVDPALESGNRLFGDGSFVLRGD